MFLRSEHQKQPEMASLVLCMLAVVFVSNTFGGASGGIPEPTAREILGLMELSQASISNLTERMDQVVDLTHELQENRTVDFVNQVHHEYRALLTVAVKSYEGTYLQVPEYWLSQHINDTRVYADVKRLLVKSRELLDSFVGDAKKVDQERQKLIILPLKEKVAALLTNMSQFIENTGKLHHAIELQSEAVYDFEQSLK